MPSIDGKNNFALLREKILGQSGKEYWRSIEEYVDSPEFADYVKYEHPEQADTWADDLSRRNFVKVMGASLALAGLSGCVIQPPEKIIPYVKANEDQLPGKALYFATAMTLGGIATGLLVKSYEGRPIKIEGNPDHPGSLGATDVLAQASLLGMYDPDRSKEVTYRGNPKTWQTFSTELRAAVEQNRQDGGAGIRFLTPTVTSPTLIAQFKQISTELPNSRWCQYEPVNNDNELAGAKMAFGSPAQAVYKFDKADRILSLDADIFNGFNVRYIKDYSKRKNYSEENKDLSRLYAIETTMSLTGAKADHRLAVKPSQLPEVAKAIAAAVGVGGAASTYTENAQWISALAKDLQGAKGKSIVIAGPHQPPVVHALAAAMNSALGNVGQTVTYIEPISPNSDKLQIDQLRELVADIDAGKVKLLVILGGNPAYNAPADLKLSAERLLAKDDKGMEKLPLRVHLGIYQDETAELCHWHVSAKHFLEEWSDTRAYDGTASIVQPLINPLYDSHNAHEVAQLFFKENYDKKDYDIVKAYWQTQNITSAPAATPAPAASSAASPVPAGTDANTSAATKTAPAPAASNAAPAAATAKTFEDHWRKVVHDGFIPNTAPTAKGVSANPAFLSQTPRPAVDDGPLEIVVLPEPSVYDGRFVNNGWLQELPRPLNKTTWENVALISAKTAERLKINHRSANDIRERSGAGEGTAFINTKGGNKFADVVDLTYQGGQIKAGVPMWISPGQPDDVITIFMGYGRSKAGSIGTGLGYSSFDVQRSDAMNIGKGNITARGEQADIASTQIHFNMEGRDLLRVWDLEQLNSDEKLGEQEDFYPESIYPYEQHQETYNQNHKWGMTIDLNSCVGCNACVIACQSENNIPVVGKEQINRSREMHWIRVDAYFGGDDMNSPEGPHFQPVLCQQCEQAPCEVVCPVHATVHSAEGLNDMSYNRCVGTRYCSNNCPYKVRRFNFLLFQDWDTPQYKLMRNPEVSVRSRGVMEKCTYCVQRIAAARIEAEKDRRAIRDGEIVTACQSVCPANAIVFGDIHDANAQVAKRKKDRRNYNLLNELNTQPRTTYLAAVKNQNKEMPDYRAPKSHSGLMGAERARPEDEKEGKEAPRTEGH